MANKSVLLCLLCAISMAAPVFSIQGNRHGGSWETEYVVTTFSPGVIPFRANDGDVVAIEDLDGDLVPDFAVVDGGGVVLFSGALDVPLWTTLFSESFSIIALDPSMERTHDWDGDGMGDLLIFDGIGKERSLIRFGGVVMAISVVTGNLLWTAFGSEFGVGAFGIDACSMPDQNGDSIPDIAVGVGNSGSNASSIFYLSGKDGSSIQERVLAHPGPFGLTAMEMMPGLDADMDGMDDLLVYLWDVPPPYSPYVMSTQSGALLYQLSDPGFLATNFMGDAVVLPDLDGDNIAEFVLPGDVPGGQLYPDGAVTCRSGADGSEIWTALGQQWQESLGAAIVGIPDWNADGVPDLAVSAPAAPVGAWPDAGQIRLVSGKNGRFIGRILGGLEDSDVHALGSSMDSSPEGDGMLVAFERGNLNGLTDGRVRYLRFEPYLTTTTTSVSDAIGGSFDLELDLPVRFADKSYALLMSKSGYGPTVIQGVKVPLSADSMLQRTRFGSHFVFFDQPYGQLDPAGHATISVALPAGALSGLIGSKIYAAVVVGDSPTGVEASSVAVVIEVTT